MGKESAIIEHIPPPKVEEGPAQMLITSLDYSNYIGRIAIGRLFRGELKANQKVALIKKDGSIVNSQIRGLYLFEGLGKTKVDCVQAGDICAIMGVEGFEIGDTICPADYPDPLPPIPIDEPTMSMVFTINNSPFFGQDGKFVTSRHLKERLEKETEKNLALRVEPTASPDAFNVVHSLS